MEVEMVVIRTSLGSAAVWRCGSGWFCQICVAAPVMFRSYKHPKHPRSHQRPWILRFLNWFCLSQNQVIICHFARKIGWNIFPILLFILSKNRRWCGERIQWNNNTASWLMGWYDNISNKNLLLLKQHNSHRLDRISRSCVPAFV